MTREEGGKGKITLENVTKAHTSKMSVLGAGQNQRT